MSMNVSFSTPLLRMTTGMSSARCGFMVSAVRADAEAWGDHDDGLGAAQDRRRSRTMATTLSGRTMSLMNVRVAVLGVDDLRDLSTRAPTARTS